MSVIYEPRGRAREYAPLACNVYSGCDHGCKYCYAPAVIRKSRQDFLISKTRNRFFAQLERDAKKLWKQCNRNPVAWIVADISQAHSLNIGDSISNVHN